MKTTMETEVVARRKLFSERLLQVCGATFEHEPHKPWEHNTGDLGGLQFHYCVRERGVLMEADRYILEVRHICDARY